MGKNTMVDDNGLYHYEWLDCYLTEKNRYPYLIKVDGRWQLKCHPHNLAPLYFWNTVINEYTKGKYRLVENYPNCEVDYEDGTPANVFFFEN